MSEREERAEKIRAASNDHPVVRFAVQSLLTDESGFQARPGLAAQLEAKLLELGPSDELVAATLGLVGLAYLLNQRASNEAAGAVLEALSKVQGLVDDALSTLPPEDTSLAAIRAARFAAFSGSTGPGIETRRPPEIGSSPMMTRAVVLGKSDKKDK